jgi:hypothetical protein
LQRAYQLTYVLLVDWLLGLQLLNFEWWEVVLAFVLLVD